MADIVAIVVAALALLGTLVQAVISGWLNLHSEERKRRDRVQDILDRYRDPLCRATEDLSYKLFNIASRGFVRVFASETASARHRSYAVLHTSYVIGQFFAWVHIIRHDTQFIMPPNADTKSRQINSILKDIRMTLLSNRVSAAPFMLWSGEQLAISEIMIVRDPKEDGGQARCMGFATFCQKWKADQEFRRWFAPIVDGLDVLRARTDGINLERLQSLQHLLVDLSEHLKDDQSSEIVRCDYAPAWCPCKACRADSAMSINIQTHSAGAIQRDVNRGRALTKEKEKGRRG